MLPRKRFSRFLIWTMVLFQAISLSLVLGVLYGTLSRTMTREFHNDLALGQADFRTTLQDRLTLHRDRLREISFNNTIRVSLMLGLKDQVKEVLSTHYPVMPEVSFFVRSFEDHSFMPEIPPDYRGLLPLFDGMEVEENLSGKFFRNGAGRFSSVNSLPIMRSTQPLGTAFMIYDVRADSRLWERSGDPWMSTVVQKTEEGFVDLRTGAPFDFPDEPLDEPAGQMLSSGEFVLLPVKDFPGLFYTATSVPLREKKQRLILTLGLLCMGVFALTVLTAMLIARRMTKPLDWMVFQAREIAEEASPLSLDETGSRYREFAMLAGAFNLVLESLREAQEQLQEKAIEALAASEDRYRLTVEAVPDAITILRLRDWRVFQVNEGFSTLTGYQAEEVVGREISRFNLFADDSARLLIERLVTGGRDINNLEVRIFRKDRRLVDVLLSARPVHLGDEMCLVAVATDITGIKRAEEALRESEEKYRNVVESLPFAFLIVQDGAVVFANAKASEYIALSDADDLIGTDPLRYIADREKPRVFGYFSARIEGRPVPVFYETMLQRTTGEELPVEVLVAETTFGGRPAIQYTVSDISEKRRVELENAALEAQLQQAHKMEAVGQLASGIAHDFNNLLQAMQGYADILLLKAGPEGAGRRELTEIVNAAGMASALTRQLLTFGRKTKGDVRLVDLNHQVRGVTELIRRTIPRMIKTELKLSFDLHAVQADPVQVEQVVMNLAVNARDAMPEGGVLTIETGNEVIDDAYCRLRPEASAGDHVYLSVSDTGLGISPERLARIYEPFYSTKAPGKGTGLGLSVVYGIVKDHHGWIACTSEPGRGTTFKIYLPASRSMLPEAFSGSEKEPSKGRGELVLFVDDEEFIRLLGEQLLTRFGYRVICAPDGETALMRYRKHKDDIALVVMDVIMPGMGGRKCTEMILEMDPAARIIIASGHPLDESWRGVLSSRSVAFLCKPYDLKDLLDEVRRTIDGNGCKDGFPC